MKHLYYKGLALLFFFVLTSSCSDSFLSENPKDRLTQNNFYKSEKDAVAAVDATYNQLYSLYERLMFLVGDLPADVEKNGIGMPNQYLQNLEFMRYTPQNTFIESLWRNNYSGINRANNAIINISTMNNQLIDDNLKNRLLGEARFLRALYYFNLVRYFGDVPLVKKIESVQDAKVGRTEKLKVYDFIIEDLNFAANNLPRGYDDNNAGRATQGAAKILLGKVYLTQKKWEKASSVLEEVIENEGQYGYGLLEDYGDNWRPAKEKSKEAVFYIDFRNPPGNGNGAMGLQGPKYSIYEGQGIPCVSNTYEADIPTEELYNSFSDDDERKSSTFQTQFSCGDNIYTSDIPIFTKYWEKGEDDGNRSDANFYVLRYADAVLMYGEALFELGNEAKALNQINRIRERAFNNSNHNYSSLSETKIWKERLLEFAQEGQRWFDLTRQGRFIETMKKHSVSEEQISGEPVRADIRNNIKDAMKLMPIPQREIDINTKLDQNPGWK